ncbi:hypothetical protein ACFLYO_05775 [Chloroflexota bacterium]
MTKRTHKHLSVTTDIPTHDYLEKRNLDDHGDLHWIVEDFIDGIERGYFLRWEAVVRQEQGLPLTQQHEKLLGELVSFGDSDERILYIDELERPSEPWHEIVRKIAPKMLLEKVDTSITYFDGVFEDWPRLAICIEKHGRDLSRPKDVKTPLDVVPVSLQHRLWLQACLDALVGLGQEKTLTLEDEEQHYRVEWFIDELKEHKESVQFLDLTLETLLTIVTLPPRDEAILVQAMLNDLGLSSMQTQIADVL